MGFSNGALDTTAQEFKGRIYKGFGSFLLHSLVTKIKNIKLKHLRLMHCWFKGGSMENPYSKKVTEYQGYPSYHVSHSKYKAEWLFLPRGGLLKTVFACASAHACVHSCVRACMSVLGVEWKGRLFGNNESVRRWCQKVRSASLQKSTKIPLLMNIWILKDILQPCRSQRR